jgi:ribosome-associated translation inhibitor RaiA
MQEAPVLRFRGVPVTADVERDIRRRIAGLDRLCPSLISCRVLVDLSARRHATGNPHRVHIDLTVPGAEIVVSHAHPDLRLAIGDAFKTARRRLQEFLRRKRA